MRGRVYKVKNFRTTQKKMSINKDLNSEHHIVAVGDSIEHGTKSCKEHRRHYRGRCYL